MMAFTDCRHPYFQGDIHMSLGTNSIDLQPQAVALDSAARERREIEPPQQACTLAHAHQIQRASIAQRHRRGEQPIGIKRGFTSRAKMVQMGVDSLIWGWLTDAMLRSDGGTLDLSDFIHPR